MAFRKNLFTVLALLSLAWICYGVYVSTSAFQTVTGAAVTPSGSLDPETAQAARTAGAGLGAGIGLTVFLCTGGLPFIVFSLLAWRNGVGLTRDKMHKEQIEALKTGKAS